MKITIKQLKQLIKEQVEESQGLISWESGDWTNGQLLDLFADAVIEADDVGHPENWEQVKKLKQKILSKMK